MREMDHGTEVVDPQIEYGKAATKLMERIMKVLDKIGDSDAPAKDCERYQRTAEYFRRLQFLCYSSGVPRKNSDSTWGIPTVCERVFAIGCRRSRDGEKSAERTEENFVKSIGCFFERVNDPPIIIAHEIYKLFAFAIHCFQFPSIDRSEWTDQQRAYGSAIGSRLKELGLEARVEELKSWIDHHILARNVEDEAAVEEDGVTAYRQTAEKLRTIICFLEQDSYASDRKMYHELNKTLTDIIDSLK